MSSPARPRGSVDWSVGSYEHVAARLQPAARAVVEHAEPAPGERVVDVGCGTGNAALLAAERGARVLGVDPAARLLDIARGRAQDESLEAEFAAGDAQSLPLKDGEADVVLSVFGVIFAPDPAAAAAEMARVTAAGGRIVLSAWVPGGAVSEAVRAAQETVRRVLGSPEGAPPFAWHQGETLAALFSPHGFEVGVDEQRIAFTAGSAREYLDEESATHPLAVAARDVLESSGEGELLRERMLSIYEAANEDPAGFRVTSRYVIASAARR